MATMTDLRTSTPPPPSFIHPPSTPRFGYEDNYEPYSPRRKSARVSQRAHAIHTPPRLGRASKKASSTDISSSPPSSPQTAPKKAPRLAGNMGGRRVSGALNFETTSTAAQALGIQPPHKMERSAALVRNNGMLPTPDKTPKKRPSASDPAISSVARNIFPIRANTVDEVMPSPKKKGRKKFTGFSLDSFEAQEEDAAIQIYTDSHDRVPDVDLSADNPFYGSARTLAVPEPTKRTSKRRKVAVAGEGDQVIEEAERREDGMVYVFRGKKIFRKFTDATDAADSGSMAHDSDTEVDVELGETIPVELRKPLTRSSIKPRLLFPTTQQIQAKEARSQMTEDEEEAVTDIDDDHVMTTPFDQVHKFAATPKAPKFAPASPPTTVRATRSKDVDMLSSPRRVSDDGSRKSSSSVSPFDSWQRTKRGPVNKKRSGSPSLTPKARGNSKKVRG